MEQSKKIDTCPICGSSNIYPKLDCPDHFLTGENFNLLACPSCSVLTTSPQPGTENIFNYYKSEDYISHSDTQKGFINFAYQKVKSITLQSKISLIKKLGPGKKLLDFGCGTGDFLFYAQQKNFHVTGIEPDESARTLAQKKGLSVHPISSLESSKEKFDFITMWHVLEHTYDPVATIQQLKSKLNDNGVLIIAVPNYASHDAQHYNSFWAAYDVPRHLFHFHPETIKFISQKVDMKLEQIKPMPFDAFYVSMLSEKYRNKNSLRGAFTGLISNIKALKSGNYSSLIYVLRKQVH